MAIHTFHQACCLKKYIAILSSSFPSNSEHSCLNYYTTLSYENQYPLIFGQLTLTSASIILILSGQARRGRASPTPPGSKDSNGTGVFLGAAGHLLGYFL